MTVQADIAHIERVPGLGIAGTPQQLTHVGLAPRRRRPDHSLIDEPLAAVA